MSPFQRASIRLYVEGADVNSLSLQREIPRGPRRWHCCSFVICRRRGWAPSKLLVLVSTLPPFLCQLLRLHHRNDRCTLTLSRVMGNWASSIQDRKALQRSANIDRIIKEDSKRFGRQPKVFLLGKELPSPLLPARLTEVAFTTGSSGSGKSTVIKQMKIVYQDGFSVEERIAYRTTIYRNLLESAQALVSAMHNVSIEPTDAQNRVRQFTPLHTSTDITS